MTLETSDASVIVTHGNKEDVVIHSQQNNDKCIHVSNNKSK
jgi:hypothetical protein